MSPSKPRSIKTASASEGWRQLSVSEMVDLLQYGSSSKTSEDASGVPVLRMGNIQDGKLDLESLKKLPHDHAEFPDLLFKDGDLLFNCTNSTNLVGKSAVYRGNPPKYSCASYLIRVRLKPEFVPEYLCNHLNSPFGRQWIASVVSQQVGQANVNGSKLKALSVPVPGFDDQRRIVAEIEKQFTRQEAGVAALRRVKANLKRYRAAVLKAAREGRLVPTEAEHARAEGRPFESGQQLLARILTERRQNWQGRGNYKKPEGPSSSEKGSLPDGWTWATFDQIAERVTVGFLGSMKHEYVQHGVPFLRGQNVRKNRFDPDGLLYVSEEFHQKLSKSALRSGDLAVVRSGSVGVTCVIPGFLPEANCSDLVLIQRPLGFVPQYGGYFMNSLAKRHVAAGKVGVALIHFNTKSVAALAVPLPPLAEQTRIVAEVERRLSVVEELEAVVTTNLQRTTRLRQAILKKAFTGKLAAP